LVIEQNESNNAINTPAKAIQENYNTLLQAYHKSLKTTNTRIPTKYKESQESNGDTTLLWSP